MSEREKRRCGWAPVVRRTGGRERRKGPEERARTGRDGQNGASLVSVGGLVDSVLRWYH